LRVDPRLFAVLAVLAGRWAISGVLMRSNLPMFVAAALALPPLFAQPEVEAWAGTWILNLAKSSYEISPAPILF